MDLSSSLIIYFIIFFIVFVVARLFCINIFSSLVLALLIGLTMLFSITPNVSADKMDNQKGYEILIYGTIIIITFLILIFYVIFMAVNDRGPLSKNNYKYITS